MLPAEFGPALEVFAEFEYDAAVQRHVLTLVAFAAFLGGCVEVMTEADRVRMVSDRANFDLSCERVQITKISDGAYGVAGCEKKVTYVLVDCADGYQKRNCTVSLDAVQQGGRTVSVSGRPPPATQVGESEK